MGFFRKAFIGGTATIGTFLWITRKDEFVPMTPTDEIYESKNFKKFNPSNNPTTHDLYVRKVPLSQLNPSLLEKKGKLVEAFCVGIWSRWGKLHRNSSSDRCVNDSVSAELGYAFQRAYLSKKYEGPETSNQLWTPNQLRGSTYDVGTVITDHFVVVEKTPERIVVRCGDTPRKTGVREADGLYEMSAVVKPDQGVAEFGVKSVFFQGLGKAEAPPMPWHIAFLHEQYSKLLLETAISNVLR